VLDEGHSRRLVVYVAPLTLGTRGTPAFAHRGPDRMDDARRFDLAGVRQLGPDVRLDYDLSDASN
jgi:riboflavin biosynthesis pyrimidine reductase